MGFGIVYCLFVIVFLYSCRFYRHVRGSYVTAVVDVEIEILRFGFFSFGVYAIF